MKFRDLELDFDIFDADTAEDYEREVNAVVEATKHKVAGETMAEGIRRQCGIVFNFFDNLMGEGFHKELFGNKVNLISCLDAFEEFNNAVKAQQEEVEARAQKYAQVTGNRATRRAVSRQHGKAGADPGLA